MANPDPLRTYTTVVDSDNFSAAAERLGLSPSAVSKQISQLEDRLGVRLLTRTTRSISPTEAGQMYYQRCKRILEELDETEQMVRDLGSQPRGTLRVILPSAFGRSMLARVVADFSQTFPHIDVELFIAEGPVDLVSSGFDVAIRFGELPDSRLVARVLGPMSLVLCASPNYLKKHGTPKTLEDLIEHQLLVVTGSDLIDIRKITPLASIIQQAESHKRFISNDLDLTYHYVHAGMGIAALPQYLIQRHVKDGRLIHLFPEFETPPQQVHIVYPKSRYVSQKLRTFIDFIKPYFEERALELQRSITLGKKK